MWPNQEDSDEEEARALARLQQRNQQDDYDSPVANGHADEQEAEAEPARQVEDNRRTRHGSEAKDGGDEGDVDDESVENGQPEEPPRRDRRSSSKPRRQRSSSVSSRISTDDPHEFAERATQKMEALRRKLEAEFNAKFAAQEKRIQKVRKRLDLERSEFEKEKRDIGGLRQRTQTERRLWDRCLRSEVDQAQVLQDLDDDVTRQADKEALLDQKLQDLMASRQKTLDDTEDFRIKQKELGQIREQLEAESDRIRHQEAEVDAQRHALAQRQHDVEDIEQNVNEETSNIEGERQSVGQDRDALLERQADIQQQRDQVVADTQELENETARLDALEEEMAATAERLARESGEIGREDSRLRERIVGFASTEEEVLQRETQLTEQFEELARLKDKLEQERRAFDKHRIAEREALERAQQQREDENSSLLADQRALQARNETLEKETRMLESQKWYITDQTEKLKAFIEKMRREKNRFDEHWAEIRQLEKEVAGMEDRDWSRERRELLAEKNQLVKKKEELLRLRKLVHSLKSDKTLRVLNEAADIVKRTLQVSKPAVVDDVDNKLLDDDFLAGFDDGDDFAV